MANDIMTTREVVALVINLRNIAQSLKLSAVDTITLCDNCAVSEKIISPCLPGRLTTAADNLYHYAQRLSTLIPDDEVVVSEKSYDDGGNGKPKTNG